MLWRCLWNESYWRRLSREIIPISLSTPVDVVQVIDEKGFEAEDITLKLYIPKPVIKTNISNNTTSTTSNTTNITKFNRTNTTNHSYY